MAASWACEQEKAQIPAGGPGLSGATVSSAQSPGLRGRASGPGARKSGGIPETAGNY